MSPSWTQNTTDIAELFEQQGEIFYLEIFKGENSNYHKNNFIAIFKRQKLKCYYFKQIIFSAVFLFFIAQKHLKKKKRVAQFFPSSFFLKVSSSAPWHFSEWQFTHWHLTDTLWTRTSGIATILIYILYSYTCRHLSTWPWPTDTARSDALSTDISPTDTS